MKSILFLSLLFVSISTFGQKATKDGQIVAKLPNRFTAEFKEADAHFKDSVPDSVILLTDFQEKELLNYDKTLRDIQDKQATLLKFILDSKNKNDYNVMGYQPGKLIVKKKMP